MTNDEKLIYDILCADEQPPEGQHWEGFVAKKIVAALAQPEPWTPDDTAYRPGGLAQPEPPCKTGSQCIGGKCLQCAQPEAEPVGWLYGIGDYAEFRRTKDGSGSAIRTPLYTAPPQRESEPPEWCKNIRRCSVRCDNCPEPLWIRNEDGKLELHAPPQREWQGLTDAEVWECYSDQGSVFYRAIEAKLREKNNMGAS